MPMEAPPRRVDSGCPRRPWKHNSPPSRSSTLGERTLSWMLSTTYSTFTDPASNGDSAPQKSYWWRGLRLKEKKTSCPSRDISHRARPTPGPFALPYYLSPDTLIFAPSGCSSSRGPLKGGRTWVGPRPALRSHATAPGRFPFPRYIYLRTLVVGRLRRGAYIDLIPCPFLTLSLVFPPTFSRVPSL